MKKILVPFSILLLFSCKGKNEEEKLVIKGVITNSPAKVIYLDEIPMTTMQRTVVDSSEIDKNGKYKLETPTGEARVFNLRMGNSDFPMAAIINDVKDIELDASFSKQNTQFPESYEVKNSPSSADMKTFMTAFNSKLQEIFVYSRMVDSLSKVETSDSIIQSTTEKARQVASEAKNIALNALNKSNNPALSMFVLGYYQSTANNPGYLLQPLDKSEVVDIITKVAEKFPNHSGIAAIRSSLEGWIGKQAPDFTLPDPNGKQISLSSFRGKWVLVDFWASWCRPCREENPNVVKVFNKYKDKNFTILGVSLDRPGQKDAWMKAVMDDNLTWTQVSDLMYWDSPVVNLYKFGDQGIPYNILVDPNGKIIAEGLRGEALDKKLEEVLK